MRYQTLGVMLLGVALIGAIAWYVFSPTYTMSKLREAALAGDVAALEERVDFPAFRESVKTGFRAQLTAEMEMEKEAGNPFVTLGSALAMGLIEPLIDRLVTPEGIKAIVAFGRIDDPERPSRSAQEQPAKWTIDRQGLDRFLAKPASDGGEAAPSVLFEREGFGWKLTGITFEPEPSGDPEA